MFNELSRAEYLGYHTQVKSKEKACHWSKTSKEIGRIIITRIRFD